MASNRQYLCSMPLQELYLDDPGNTNQPKNYALCSDSGNTCDESGCHCRHGATVSIDGSKVFIGVCELVDDGKSCSKAGSSKAIDCGSFDSSSSSNPSLASSASDSGDGKKSTKSSKTAKPSVRSADSSRNGKSSLRSADSSDSGENSETPHESREAISSNSGGTKQSSGATNAGNNGQTTVTPIDSSFSTAPSTDSANTNPASISHTASSSGTVNTPVIVAIVIICIVFVALVSCFVRRYCAKKVAAEKTKMSTHDAASPTNTSGGSSATPPTYPPSIDRRTRSVDSGNGVYYERRSSRAAGGSRSADYSGEYGNAMPPSSYGQSDRQMNIVPQQFDGYDQASPYAYAPGFHMDESQASPGYPELSRTGSRSIAPSVASSAATAAIPGRRRPSSKRQQRLAHSIAPSVASTATTVAMPGRRRQTKGSKDRRQVSNRDRSSGDSGFEASVASEAPSVWSSASADDYIPPFRLLRQQESGNQ